MYSKTFYLIETWCYTRTDEIHPRQHSLTSRIVTLSNQSDFWNVNLPVFKGASPFSYRFWFCSHRYTIVSVVNNSHQNKQKNSHLLKHPAQTPPNERLIYATKFKKHWRNSREFAFKFYRILVCL